MDNKKAKQILFDKLVVTGSNCLSKSVLDNMDVSEFERWLTTNNVVQQFFTIILGNERAMTIHYYSTWWQEIRQKFLPKFWLKKYPSLKTKIHAQVSFPTMEYPDGMFHKPYVRIHNEHDLTKEQQERYP